MIGLEKIRPSTYACAAILGGVALYDYVCPPGEQISERFDEWIDHPAKRIAAEAVVAAFALHLTNRIDPKYDVISMIGCFKPKVRELL